MNQWIFPHSQGFYLLQAEISALNNVSTKNHHLLSYEKPEVTMVSFETPKTLMGVFF